MFKHLTAEEVRAAIKVTSGRDSAAFGFNNASVEVHLPIDEKFSAPKLFDKKQREVKFEKEQGIYDHERWSTEVRFTSLDNKPVDFAKAVGSVRIKVPLAMKTVSLKKTETKKAQDAGNAFDGPFIRANLAKVPESAFASDLSGVRAYDKSGKRLERVMVYSSSSWKDGVSYRGYAFHGDVARVDVDMVDEWIALQIDYEMPPAPKLSRDKTGTPSTAPSTIAETPGGRYTVKVFRSRSRDAGVVKPSPAQVTTRDEYHDGV